ncbi:MAG: hypothetical protein K0U24_00620 [Gammaproteobacteria bacterium]|nr:hypothetical protein [Gammaproteobacteria bacterium]
MKREDQLFFLGLVSLVLSLFLFPFGAYLFPAVWLGWEYHIPSFVLHASAWIQATFNMPYLDAFRWFFRLTFVFGILFAVIAYFISHHITKLKTEAEAEAERLEHAEYEEHAAPDDLNIEITRDISGKPQESTKDTVLFFIKMVVILTLVFIVSDMIEWAISFTPQQQ